MSYLDRRDLLSADLMTRSITKEGSIKYYNTDKNVANIYMKLMAESPDGAQKEVAVDEASNYTVKIDVIKPKTNQIRTVPGVLSTDLTDETCAIWKFELGEDFTNQIGEVICQTYIKNSTQNLTMRYFAYTVEADKLTGLNSEIVTDPDLPILKELIKEVQETAQTVNNIDNVNVSDTKTYSNKKIEEKFSGVDAQFNTIEQDTLSGKSFRYLTQAEYDALSIEDKNNDSVVWCITDTDIQNDNSLFSPDGSKWALKVANDGTLTAEKIFVSAESVVLNNTSYTLNAEQTLQLVATVLPAGSNQNATWSSSNTNVATVSSSGLVTSIGGGSATITVTTVDGGFTANCNLTVNAPIVFTNYIYNTETYTNPASGTHPNYSTYYLSYNVTKSIAGGVATLTKTSQINEASYLTVKHSVGDTKVYYIQVKIKTNSSGIRFGNNSIPAQLVSVTNDGQYHVYSYILTDTSTTGGWLTIDLRNIEINSVCEVKEIMKICLTDIYGAGNEPDLATCNSVFTSYKTGLVG